MTSDTRAKMVAGAADLMSRRGVNATSLRDVVRHTGTPRGSIGHHFPRGKQQLIEDALVFAGKQVSGPLSASDARSMARSAAYALSLRLWRQTLERTKFQAGCPVLAVAVEQYVNDATEKDGEPDEAAQQRLLDLAEGVFAEWQRIMFAALRREGVAPRAPGGLRRSSSHRRKARSRCAAPRAAPSRSTMSGRNWNWYFRARWRSNAAVHAAPPALAASHPA